jgi:hypothetical protein
MMLGGQSRHGGFDFDQLLQCVKVMVQSPPNLSFFCRAVDCPA